MTVLRLTPVRGTGIGAALAAAGDAALARRDGAAFVEVPVAVVPRLVRTLAFAGIAAEACDADLVPPPGLFPAVGMDLSPLPHALLAVDIVRIRRINLGAATREILRRRLGGVLPAPASARTRCRSLIRGEDVLFAWDRRAWGSRTALRSAGARRRLRPVVFDPHVLTQVDLAGRTSARDDALARWLFA